MIGMILDVLMVGGLVVSGLCVLTLFLGMIVGHDDY